MEELYEYNGEKYTYAQLQERYGDQTDSTIEHYGFKKSEVNTEKQPVSNPERYAYNGEEYSREDLEATYGEETDATIAYYGFEEVKKKQAPNESIVGGLNFDDGSLDFSQSEAKIEKQPLTTSPQPKSIDKEARLDSEKKAILEPVRRRLMNERADFLQEAKSNIEKKAENLELEDIVQGNDVIGDADRDKMANYNRMLNNKGGKGLDIELESDYGQKAKDEAFKGIVTNELQPEYSVSKLTKDFIKDNPDIPTDVAERKVKTQRMVAAHDMLPSERSKELHSLNMRVASAEFKLKADPENSKLKNEFYELKMQLNNEMKGSKWWASNDDNTSMFGADGKPTDQDFREHMETVGKDDFLKDLKNRYKKFDAASKDKKAFTLLWNDKFEKLEAIKSKWEIASAERIESITWSHFSQDEEKAKREKAGAFWKEKFTDAKMDFSAINEILLTNVDPSSVKRHWYDSVLTGVDKGFAANVDEYSGDQVAEIYQKVAGDEEFSITKGQQLNAELSFSDEALRGIGSSLPAMAELAVTTAGTQALGTLPVMARLAALSRLKYGKLGQRTFEFIKGATLDGAAYGLAPSDDLSVSMGVGEHVGQNIFAGIEDKLGKMSNKYLRYISKIGIGSISETSAEYVGDFADELTENGFDIQAAITTVVGETTDEALRKLALTAITTTAFSSVSNTTKAVMTKTKAEVESLPESEGKTKLKKLLDEADSVQNGELLNDGKIDETKTKTDTETKAESETKKENEIDEDFTEDVFDTDETGDAELDVEIEAEPIVSEKIEEKTDSETKVENQEISDENVDSDILAETKTDVIADTSPETKTEVVTEKPKRQPKQKAVISKNGNYQIKKSKDGKVEIYNRDGKKAKVTDKTKRVYVEEYIAKTNFDKGKLAIDENTPYEINEAEAVSNFSENPQEVALALTNGEFDIAENNRQDAIARNVNNVSRESFEGAVGYSAKKEGVTQSYFSENGDSLDTIQMAIHDTMGIEYDAMNPAVTIEEITSFMLGNKGAGQVLNQSNPVQSNLLAKFEELTGLIPSTKNIEAVASKSDLYNPSYKDNFESEMVIDWEAEGEIAFEGKESFGKDKKVTDHITKSNGNLDKFTENIETVKNEIESAKQDGKNQKRPKSTETENPDSGRRLSLPKGVQKTSIIEGFAESLYVDFVGTEVSSPQDVADLYLIHRSPYIEKGHVVYVKNGKIVKTTAETLGLPYATTFEQKGGSKVIKNTAKNLGADKIYFIHNHPSGNPTPSSQDVAITVEMSKKLGNTSVEHLVIDTDKFSVIDRDGKVKRESYKNKPKPLFDKRFDVEGSQDKMFEVATQLSKGGAPHHIVYLDTKNRIAGYEIIDGSEGNLKDYVNNGMRKQGASNFVVVTDGSNSNINTLQGNEVSNRLDFIKIDKNGVAESLAEPTENAIPSEGSILWDSQKGYDRSMFGDDSLIEKNKELKKLYQKAANSYKRLKTSGARAAAIRKELRASIKEYLDFDLNAAEISQAMNAIEKAKTPASMQNALEVFDAIKTKAQKRTLKKEYEQQLKDAKQADFEAIKEQIQADVEALAQDFFKVALDNKNVQGIRKSEVKKIYDTLTKAKTAKQISEAAKKLENLFYDLESRVSMKAINAILKRKLVIKDNGRIKGNIGKTAEQVIGSVKEELKRYTTERKTVPREGKAGFDMGYVLDLVALQNDLYANLANLTEIEMNTLAALRITIGILNPKTITSSLDKLKSLKGAEMELESIYADGRSEHLDRLEKKREKRNKSVMRGVNNNNVQGKKLKSDPDAIKSARNKTWTFMSKAIFDWTSGKQMGDLEDTLLVIDKKGNRNTNEGWASEMIEDIKEAATNKAFNVRKYQQEIKQKQREIFGEGKGISTKNKSILGIKVKGKTYGNASDFKMGEILNKQHKFTVNSVDIDMKKSGYNLKSEPHPVTGEKVYQHMSPEEITLSESQLLNLWMHYKNEETHEGFITAGYDAAFMANVDKILNPKTKAYGEVLFDFYDNYYNHINTVYESMYGHDLGRAEFYAGKLGRKGYSQEAENLMDGLAVARTTAGGSTKERTNTALPVVASDVNIALSRYINESEHFVQYAEVHSEFNALIEDKRFQTSVLNNDPYIGDSLLEQLKYYRDNEMVRGGKEKTALRIIDILMGNLVKSTLALKPTIALTQTLSIPNAVKFLPRGNNSLKGYNPVSFYNDMVHIFNNSKYISNRLDTSTLSKAISGLDTIDTGELLSGKAGGTVKQFSRVYDALQNSLMVNVKVGDMIGVMGSVPVYTGWKAEYLERGMKPEKAEAKAMKKFESAVDRAQQGQTKFGKSQLQDNPIGKMFSMFATSPMQNFRNSVASYREIGRYFKRDAQNQRTNKGSVFRHVVSIANFSLVQPLIYTWVAGRLKGSLMSMFGGGDDEELTDADKSLMSAIILRNTASIPIVGSAMLFAVDEMLEKEHTFGGLLDNPVMHEADKIKEYYNKAKQAKTEKSKQDNWNMMLRSFEKLCTGLPITTTLKYLDLLKAIDAYEDEYDAVENFWIRMGHSEWSIDQDRKAEAKKGTVSNSFNF